MQKTTPCAWCSMYMNCPRLFTKHQPMNRYWFPLNSLKSIQSFQVCYVYTNHKCSINRMNEIDSKMASIRNSDWLIWCRHSCSNRTKMKKRTIRKCCWNDMRIKVEYKHTLSFDERLWQHDTHNFREHNTKMFELFKMRRQP